MFREKSFTMWEIIKEGSITSVPGFRAAGIHAGLKKKKKDLALIYSELDCVAAGVFTTNKVVAAPVTICKDILDKQSGVRAVIVNSGNANSCTGERGYKDALEMKNYCAEKLGVDKSAVLVSSTGVIGEYLNMSKVKEGIETIVTRLSKEGGEDAAEAILTTDKVIKQCSVKIKMGEREINIGGMSKGSGMIMPNMATMLAFITTDADISKNALQKLVTSASDKTFNRISVDGETSTNDMVLMMANGISGVQVTEETALYDIFEEALTAMCKVLAKAIVADGEGATKFVTVFVNKAKTESDANLVAKAIATSPLVKTALNGEDANWGRIISSAGMSGADFNPANVQIKFGDLPILNPNFEVVVDEVKAKEILSEKEIVLNVNLNEGNCATEWWTCDYSEEYIKINAYYRT